MITKNRKRGAGKEEDPIVPMPQIPRYREKPMSTKDTASSSNRRETRHC
jgi:hypothetical protein